MARGVIAGLFQAAYVYTPEVYPTALRSVGVGGCSTLARLGAMATPYVAQVTFEYLKPTMDYEFCDFRFCCKLHCGVPSRCTVLLQYAPVWLACCFRTKREEPIWLSLLYKYYILFYYVFLVEN